MTTARLNIVVDRQLCIGAAACVGSAPQLFQLDEDNVATVKVTVPLTATDEERRMIMDAAESCPTGAISVTAAD